MGKRQITEYKGVVYPSLNAAAKAVAAETGLSITGARQRFTRGNLHGRNPCKPCRYKGVIYPTVTMASEARRIFAKKELA